MVESRIPPSTKEEIRKYYRSAISTLLSYGMTGVHDMEVTLPMAEVFLAMADDDELDMRISAFLDTKTGAHEKIGKPIRGYGNERLDLAAVKIYADGALGSRGAALIEPYSDDVENRGLVFFGQDELDAMTIRANELGFQVGTHAIGDLGNRMVLDAFEAAQGGEPSPLRNRIEHAQVIALDDIPRFAELGVIASMQPTHATSDMNMAEDRVGPDRIRGAYAWRRLLDSGAILAAGSDFVVEHPNPFYGLYSAVTRQDHGGNPQGGWYIDQGLTRAEALHAFTLAAAYAGRQEDSLGSLEPGKWADFILTDKDYFEVAAAEIHAIKVLETWVAGEKVYAAEDTE
jgi:predicted amidohydrolase YtcJ